MVPAHQLFLSHCFPFAFPPWTLCFAFKQFYSRVCEIAPLSSSYNDFLFPKSMLIRVVVTEVRKGWVGRANYIWIIASRFLVPQTQCRWYDCPHSRGRSATKETGNLGGRHTTSTGVSLIDLGIPPANLSFLVNEGDSVRGPCQG